MKSLVGYTGFVGTNLAHSTDFDFYYNSKNIKDAYGTNPDLLVYAGVPAQKFIANKFPSQDLKTINEAIENIKKINPKKIILISTIDIYKNPFNVDENTIINEEDNQPYGKNRYILEKWVMNHFKNHLIVRLPGLYGKNIKKNFIYDLIHIIPSMLKKEKFDELNAKDNLISSYYMLQEDGFYKVKNLTKNEEKELKNYFNKINFSALNFTDSRGNYQFYNLKYLWYHITIALENNIKILNLATEPVNISEVYSYVTNKKIQNELTNQVPNYNYKTIHHKLFKGNNGYVFSKKFILEDIKQFIDNELNYKLSISNIAWQEENDEEIYKYIAEAGFSGLEIAPTRIIKEKPYEHIETIKEFKNKIELKYGLQISSMQSIWYGKTENIFNSKKEREKLLEYTKQAIDFASMANCGNLVFGCPKNRNIINEKKSNNNIAKEFFKQIGLYAKEKNVVFAIEPNPSIYNTNFINTTQEAIDIVKEIDIDSIKVNLDLGTIIVNNEDIDTLIDNMKYINHIHISEPFLEKIEKRELHQKLKQILKKTNYSNYVSIEMKSSNIDEVKETIKYIKEIFK